MTPGGLKPYQDLGAEQVPEAAYAADFTLLDKYQGFSAELLRLALVGIAAFGFLLEQFSIASIAGPARILAAAAMVLLTVSAGFALGHRYLSSDGMFHHLRLLRLAQRLKATTEARAVAVLNQVSTLDRARRGSRYQLSGYCLGLSSLFLLLGTVALAAFIVVLLVTAPELKK